jgi:hypothetical protein
MKMEKEKPGYDDTPFIPGSKYRVHDKERPQPPVVTPGQAVGQPPSDAVVLFDGRDLSAWTGKEGEAKWKVENGYMEVLPGTGNISTKEKFGDCQLHVEWATPEKVEGEDQHRGNSGVFLMELYEIQVLDNYENLTYPDGTAAAIYGQTPPMVNACREPGKWQSYEIVWFAPRFEGEKLVSPARLTLFHNGILVHHNQELKGPTTHRKVLEYQAHPSVGSLMLQDHRDCVRYRNIWYRKI